MGVLSMIFKKLSSVLKFFSMEMPKFVVDYGLFGKSLSVMRPYWSKADKIFPMHETLFVLGILVSFSIFMFVYWCIMKFINFVRGCG